MVEERARRIPTAGAQCCRHVAVVGDGPFQPKPPFAELRASQPQRGDATTQLAERNPVALRVKPFQRLAQVVRFGSDDIEPGRIAREGVEKIEISDQAAEKGRVPIARAVFIAVGAKALVVTLGSSPAW